MDNITHTLAGLLIGEAMYRFVPMPAATLPQESRRGAGVALMILGSNLPDADSLYPYLSGSKLDYLLEHRGHTHTIVGALLISAVMLLAVWVWLRIRHQRWSRGDAIYLGLLALLAPLLHIAMDYTNNYGVHPFWPVNSAWYYGDAVYIVERLLWACATPLLFTLQTRMGRAVIVLVLLAAIALCVGTGLVPKALVLALLVLMVLLGVIGRLASARVALASGIATWLALTAMFLQTASIADARIARLATQAFPGARTLDRILTPLPVNPFCRDVLVVQTEADRYVVRKARHALAPGWLPVSDCPSPKAEQHGTAHFTPAPAAGNDEIAWLGEISMPRGQLAGLSAEYCAVRALLRFARAPFAIADGTGWIVGDLRYDREPGLGFAEVRVAPNQADCPVRVPAWRPPRADLLHGHL